MGFLASDKQRTKGEEEMYLEPKVQIKRIVSGGPTSAVALSIRRCCRRRNISCVSQTV